MEKQKTEKGGLGCLVVLVVLAALGVVLWSHLNRTKELTPEQRAELTRLIGHFEGASTDSAVTLAPQWEVVWKVDFSINKSNQLVCDCVPVLYQNGSEQHPFFTLESTPVHYDDRESGKTGIVEVASSKQHRGWKIYVEQPALQSGDAIDSILLKSDDFGQCTLHRVTTSVTDTTGLK